jgi:hypothetical protein
MANLRKSKNGSVPSSGATQPARKAGATTIQTAPNLKPSSVRNAAAVTGAHAKAVDQQNNGNVLVVSNTVEDAIAARRTKINKDARSK